MKYNIPISVLCIVILAAIVFTYGLKTSRRKIVVLKGENSILINLNLFCGFIFSKTKQVSWDVYTYRSVKLHVPIKFVSGT